MKTYNRGDSFYITLTHELYSFVTDVWAAADPDGGAPKITIIDADGKATAVAATAMGGVAGDGKYEYQYEIESGAALGTWSGYIDVENNNYPDRKYFNFEVIA